MVLNIDNKIDLIRKTIKNIVDPPPPPIMAKADIRATSHFFTPADSHSLGNIQITNIGPQNRMPDNSTMDPKLVGRLPFALTPAEIEMHVFATLKNASLLSVGQLRYDIFQSIFNKNGSKSWIATKN